jgi:putative inorganic carbon (HCO3(-)) transporter
MVERLPVLTLLAALVVLPLYPKIGLVDVPNTYIPVRIDDIVIAVVAGVWLASLAIERRRPDLPRWIAIGVGAWIGAALVGLLVGVFVFKTVAPLTALGFWAKPIEYVLLGAVAFDLVRTGRVSLSQVVKVVLATAAIVIGYGLLERVGVVPHLPGIVPPPGVVTSTFGDLHELAGYVGIVALLLAALAHRAPSRGWRWLAIAGVVACGAITYFTAVRTEYLALGMCMVALATWRPARAPAIAGLIAMAALFSSPVIVTQVDALWTQAFGSSVLPAEPDVNVTTRYTDATFSYSWNERFNVKWPAFFASAMRDPIFGVGPSAATEAADGYYMRIFVEAGIVGLLAFLGLLAAIALALWRSVRGAAATALTRPVAIAMLLSTIFVAAVSVLIDTWIASRVMELYWPLLGATLAASWSVVARAPAQARSVWETLLARAS